MVKVEHVMKQDLVCLQKGQSVTTAAMLMRTRHIGSVFVKHQG